ncbi:MAG: DUF4395 domain-containing protein [Actinotalea sp.]|nr:DUF4395 domain-containing protein [Actinotalea sp.]
MTTPGPTDSPLAHPGTGIDPRGPRFGAAVTTVLLAATLLAAGTTAGTVLLAVAVALFVVGVARGAQGSVQGVLYRRLVRPRLGPPSHLEDPAPPRFAQLVGLLVTGAGLVLALVGVPGAVAVAAGIALVAAFLNAAFGLCLGCEMYVLLRRLRPAT